MYYCKIPLSRKYHPELYTSKFLNDKRVNMCQPYRGILCWCVYLPRIDITFTAYQMAQYQKVPRYHNIMALGQVFSYLNNNQHLKLLFDPAQIGFINRNSYKAHWSRFYKDVKEAVTLDEPNTTGKVGHVYLFIGGTYMENLFKRM